jgi:hypothetical protein
MRSRASLKTAQMAMNWVSSTPTGDDGRCRFCGGAKFVAPIPEFRVF